MRDVITEQLCCCLCQCPGMGSSGCEVNIEHLCHCLCQCFGMGSSRSFKRGKYQLFSKLSSNLSITQVAQLFETFVQCDRVMKPRPVEGVPVRTNIST